MDEAEPISAEEAVENLLIMAEQGDMHAANILAIFVWMPTRHDYWQQECMCLGPVHEDSCQDC